MGWWFSKKPQNPLDLAGLRPLLEVAERGDLKAAASQVKEARAARGDVPAVRFLECRIYHDAGKADPGELLEHLKPALAGPEGQAFLDARLLEVELFGALGQFDQAAGALNLLGREKLKGKPQEAAQKLAAELERWRGSAGLALIKTEAETLATDLACHDLVIRWRASDLARIDDLLDQKPELAREDGRRFAALIGEIACRAGDGRWRLALRPEQCSVKLGASDWRVGPELSARLASGAPLYRSFHKAKGSPFTAIPGVVGVDAHIEPGVHLAVAVDHVARALLQASVLGLGVFRERPTPEGPVVLPVSFLDKGGELRLLYLETRAWDNERLAELRRWLGRVRTSVVRAAAVSLLSAHTPPQAAIDLVEGRAEIPPVPSILSDPRTIGARAATPRSLDEPKLDWLDQKAEMMERLVAAAVGSVSPSDLEVVKKIQGTVVQSFRPLSGNFSPKQWNALYGYGALYGRILARSFNGRWAALGDDRAPAEWEMQFPWGRVAHPIALMLELAEPGRAETTLVNHFLDVRAEAEV